MDALIFRGFQGFFPKRYSDYSFMAALFNAAVLSGAIPLRHEHIHADFISSGV